MKISNFQIDILNFNRLADFRFMQTPIFAEVDVQTGFLFWKKTERKRVFKLGSFWRFVDSQKHCPGFDVETLESEYLINSKLQKMMGGEK